MFWMQSADRVNYICEQNSSSYFLLCWAHQPLPLGCTFSRIQHNALSFLAGQWLRCTAWSPCACLGPVWRGACSLRSVCTCVWNQCSCIITGQNQLSSARAEWKCWSWCGHCPLSRSESQQVLTHQVMLLHAANSVFFVFLLLSIGWWKNCGRAWLALWEFSRTFWLVSVQLCRKNTRRRKSFIS